jgi:hypothetical protein
MLGTSVEARREYYRRALIEINRNDFCERIVVATSRGIASAIKNDGNADLGSRLVFGILQTLLGGT